MPQRILKTAHLARAVTVACLLYGGARCYAGDILVSVEGIQASGVIYAALVDANQEAWQPLRTEEGHGPELVFTDVTPGQYAVQIFQDINSNGELDQSRRGLPLEPVGLSGNPKLASGKPSPIKASFIHGNTDTHVNIRLQSKGHR